MPPAWFTRGRGEQDVEEAPTAAIAPGEEPLTDRHEEDTNDDDTNDDDTNEEDTNEEDTPIRGKEKEEVAKLGSKKTTGVPNWHPRETQAALECFNSANLEKQQSTAAERYKFVGTSCSHTTTITNCVRGMPSDLNFFF